MKYFTRCMCISFVLCYLITTKVCAQQWGIKTNVLSDATGTAHLGVEYGFSSHGSLELSGFYKAWDFSEHRKWRILALQPEIRYWFCERMNGHYVGVHAHWAKFNVAQIDMPLGIWKELEKRRFQGDLWGAGISYGYHWLLAEHWNLEAGMGAGYAKVKYDKYPCARCGRLLESGTKNYWGLTKVVLGVVYLF